MSRTSRSYAGAALVVAWMAIPVLAQAQTGAAERGLMNLIVPDLTSQVSEHEPGATPETGEPSQASRALLGAVSPIGFAASEKAGVADVGFPTPGQALLGQISLRPGSRWPCDHGATGS
jgi:hypothetical protein